MELPGPILVGEGKPNNQNHAIIFTRGEAVQAIDMNQDGGKLHARGGGHQPQKVCLFLLSFFAEKAA